MAISTGAMALQKATVLLWPANTEPQTMLMHGLRKLELNGEKLLRLIFTNHYKLRTVTTV